LALGDQYETTRETAKLATGCLHGGRTGWGTNYGSTGGAVSGAKRYPYQSVLIDTLRQTEKGSDGDFPSYEVRSAATVIADLAQKYSGRSRSRYLSKFGCSVDLK
jgi:hypothetical protein